MSKEQVKTAENTEEAVYREVEETEGENKKKLKCAIIVAITEDNEMFVELEGYEQNLIHIEGLLGYAERHVDNLWKNALASNDNKEG